MDGLELHGQRSQAPVAGQPERRVLFEDFAVEVNTDVGSHVLGANLQNLRREAEKRNELQFLTARQVLRFQLPAENEVSLDPQRVWKATKTQRGSSGGGAKCCFVVNWFLPEPCEDVLCDVREAGEGITGSFVVRKTKRIWPFSHFLIYFIRQNHMTTSAAQF